MTIIFTALFAWMCVLNGQKAREKGLSATKYQWITTACFGTVGVIGGIIQFVNWLNLVFWSTSYYMQPWANGGSWSWSSANPFVSLYNGTLMGTKATMVWLLFVIIAAVVSYAITNSAPANIGNGQPQSPPSHPTPPPVQPNPASRAGQNSQWQAPTKENQSFEVNLHKENEARDKDNGEWN